MEIPEAFDRTRCAHSAAHLAGVDEKTVTRYVTLRDSGHDPFQRSRRARLIDPFLDKIEEMVEDSQARVRAQRLVTMGFSGTDRSTRRAVAESKAAFKAGHRRKYRPWVPEPGMWLQFVWGEGPRVGGRRTQLFCAWLSWSRFRVVLPSWDQTLGSPVRPPSRVTASATSSSVWWTRPAQIPQKTEDAQTADVRPRQPRPAPQTRPAHRVG
jgi:hypothetical protein